MSAKNSSIYHSDDLPLKREDRLRRAQIVTGIKRVILNFIDNPPNIQRRRYIIACNQMLSLYRRMNYHPENIALCQFYKNRIKQIIKLEKGKEK